MRSWLIFESFRVYFSLFRTELISCDFHIYPVKEASDSCFDSSINSWMSSIINFHMWFWVSLFFCVLVQFCVFAEGKWWESRICGVSSRSKEVKVFDLRVREVTLAVLNPNLRVSSFLFLDLREFGRGDFSQAFQDKMIG